MLIWKRSELPLRQRRRAKLSLKLKCKALVVWCVVVRARVLVGLRLWTRGCDIFNMWPCRVGYRLWLSRRRRS